MICDILREYTHVWKFIIDASLRTPSLALLHTLPHSLCRNLHRTTFCAQLDEFVLFKQRISEHAKFSILLLTQFSHFVLKLRDLPIFRFSLEWRHQGVHFICNDVRTVTTEKYTTD